MAPTVTSSIDAPAALRRLLGDAPAPLSFSALQKRTKIPKEELGRILEEQRARGAVHPWPRYRGQQRFWHRAPEELAREQVLTSAAECALPPKALAAAVKKRSHGYPDKLIAGLIQQLVREKELRKYASFGREKELLGREGYPQAYAAAAKLAIDQILGKLAPEGADLEDVRASLSQPAATSLEDAILAAMAQMEPSRTVPVSVRELRAALPQAGKQAFDAAALRLLRRREVFLSRHDFPQSLPPEQRDALIDGQDGNWYVAITARSE